LRKTGRIRIKLNREPVCTHERGCMSNYVTDELSQTREVIDELSRNVAVHRLIETVGGVCVRALRSGNKLLFAGNGGSAADAQHIAGEFVSRFMYDRPGLAAFALTTDTSVLTAIGNDYGYEKIFARQIQAVGKSGDVFFGISTSGRSPNILTGFIEARSQGLTTVGLTGKNGFAADKICDYEIRVPSERTPRIQEGHIAIAHALCGLVESVCYPKCP
jgi:D-sedoheptulose 7-phosphate isomerase